MRFFAAFVSDAAAAASIATAASFAAAAVASSAALANTRCYSGNRHFHGTTRQQAKMAGAKLIPASVLGGKLRSHFYVSRSAC